jgi:hypothetical protein
VATTQVLTQRVPRFTTLAVRSVFKPRIGLSRAFSRPWSHSTLLFWFWPVLCGAAGTRFSITCAHAEAPVVDNLARVAVNSQGNREEMRPAGNVPTLRDVHVDHLGPPDDRSVDVGPGSGDLDAGLVDEPAVPGRC